MRSIPRAKVAQLVEHAPEKCGVDGSIPSLGTKSREDWEKLLLVLSLYVCHGVGTTPCYLSGTNRAACGRRTRSCGAKPFLHARDGNGRVRLRRAPLVVKSVLGVVTMELGGAPAAEFAFDLVGAFDFEEPRLRAPNAPGSARDLCRIAGFGGGYPYQMLAASNLCRCMTPIIASAPPMQNPITPTRAAPCSRS